MTNFSIAGASEQAYTQTRPHPDPAPERPLEPHDTNTRSAIRLATLRNPSRSTEPIRYGARCGKAAPQPFHPTADAPYEHVFWRSPHPQASLRAVHRAVDLARAALFLEPTLEDAHELVDARASHPHRTQSWRAPAPRRPGAVLARPQHCITPLVRSAPCGRELAGRR